MKKLLVMLVCLALVGCGSINTYKEGTMLQLGAYVPTGDSLVGIEVLNYLSGCVVRANSNQAFKVTREFAATNSYFGMVKVQERTKTTVEVNNDEVKGNDRGKD